VFNLRVNDVADSLSYQYAMYFIKLAVYFLTYVYLVHDEGLAAMFIVYTPAVCFGYFFAFAGLFL